MIGININKLLVLILLVPAWLFGQDHYHEPSSYDIRHKGRLYWQMPRRVTDEIGIKEGMNVADVGCGDGFFTLVLAEKVGTEGEVFAEDIDEGALEVLEGRRLQEGFENVTIIHGNPDDPKLPEGIVDIALMVNTLHFIGNPETFFGHIRKSLTPEGRLVVIQWAAEKMDPELPGWDPGDREKYTLRTSLEHIALARFRVVDQLEFLPMQYIFICRPLE